MFIADFVRLTKDCKDLGCRVLPDHSAHLLVVRRAVLLEEVECVCLRRRLRVWLVEQRLDAEEDFFDGDGRFPAFFFVEDGEADGA